MERFALIGILFFALALVVLPEHFYKMRNRRMILFCVRMSLNVHAQMLYSFLLELAILFCNYCFGSAILDWGVMLGVLPIAYFFSPKRTIPFLRRLRSDRRLLVMDFSATLVAAFVPHLLPLAMISAFVIVAVCFFPSEMVEGQISLEWLQQNADCTDEDAGDLIRQYFI